MLVGEQGSAGARAPLSSGRGSGGNRYSRLLVRLPTPRAAGQMLPRNGIYLHHGITDGGDNYNLESRKIRVSLDRLTESTFSIFRGIQNFAESSVRLCELLDS